MTREELKGLAFEDITEETLNKVLESFDVKRVKRHNWEKHNGRRVQEVEVIMNDQYKDDLGNMCQEKDIFCETYVFYLSKYPRRAA